MASIVELCRKRLQWRIYLSDKQECPEAIRLLTLAGIVTPVVATSGSGIPLDAEANEKSMWLCTNSSESHPHAFADAPLKLILFAQDFIDALNEDMIGRITHWPMTMTSDFIELGIWAANKVHHSPHHYGFKLLIFYKNTKTGNQESFLKKSVICETFIR